MVYGVVPEDVVSPKLQMTESDIQGRLASAYQYASVKNQEVANKKEHSYMAKRTAGSIDAAYFIRSWHTTKKRAQPTRRGPADDAKREGASMGGHNTFP